MKTGKLSLWFAATLAVSFSCTAVAAGERIARLAIGIGFVEEVGPTREAIAVPANFLERGLASESLIFSQFSGGALAGKK